MRSMLALLCLVATCVSGLSACTAKPTKIGTACKTTADCNVTGQVCAPGLEGGASICTHTCATQSGDTGCPVGFDCYPADATIGMTCNKARYEVAPTGAPLLIGVDCSKDDTVCGSLGSTNAALSCRKLENTTTKMPNPNDPAAYCTGVCSTDADCPLQFECLTDYDKAKKCLRRALCSECVVNDNCPADNPICIPTKDGTSHYCSKTCGKAGDCGGVQNTAFVCDFTSDSTGSDVAACIHRFGACVGQGNVCDPCRSDADCSHAGNACYQNIASGEAFCIKGCKADADCSPATLTNIKCDNTDLYDPKTNPGGMSGEICNADATPGAITCWPAL